jgi:LPPG:FO 2-phospho-L-lactate transferase
VERHAQVGPTTRAVPLLMTDINAAATMAREALGLAETVRA